MEIKAVDVIENGRGTAGSRAEGSGGHGSESGERSHPEDAGDLQFLCKNLKSEVTEGQDMRKLLLNIQFRFFKDVSV